MFKKILITIFLSTALTSAAYATLCPATLQGDSFLGAVAYITPNDNTMNALACCYATHDPNSAEAFVLTGGNVQSLVTAGSSWVQQSVSGPPALLNCANNAVPEGEESGTPYVCNSSNPNSCGFNSTSSNFKLIKVNTK